MKRLALVLVCELLLQSPLAAQSPRARPKLAPQVAKQNGYELAFLDADVRRVIDAVLGTMLGAQYTVDPAVTGNITLKTPRPVPRDALVSLLESALRPIGAVIVVDGSSYRIVPRAAAREGAPLADNDPAGEKGSAAPISGFASEVVELQNASAREVAKVLTQLLGKDIVLGTNDGLNQIIISGTSEERQGARALVARFDVDSLARMAFELFQLDNVDADTLDSELKRIFKPPYDIIGSRVRLVPLARLRAILVIAADRADIAKIEPWIRRLDIGGSGKRKLYSYVIQNGRARDIAGALQLVLGGSGGGQQPTPDAEQADPFAGSNSRAAGSASGAIGAEPSREVSAAAATPAQASDTVSAGSGGLRIVPNESNNSLLIFASGEEYQFIKEALEKLDQPVPQVLIEATLAEVTLTDDFRFGVNLDGVTGITRLTNSNAATAIPTAILPGFSATFAGSAVQAVLNTLQSKTNVRVLSAPKLIVLNNQTATLQVGDQVPIITQQSQSVASPGAPIVNNVELRDTGVILKVTPRVNDSGTVTLDIAQEVSDVSETTTSGINSPTIQQRRLTSTVSTDSGQLIVLGGLIRDRSTLSKSGFPLLSQIPVLGGLFGTRQTRGIRTELIILLTPTVIRSPKDVRGIVDTLLDRLDQTKPLLQLLDKGPREKPRR